jgi:predicted TIM-barrel fold metal-dependent hydrolase
VIIFDAHVHLGQRSFVQTPSAEEAELPIYRNARENCWNVYARHAAKKRIFKALVFPFPFPHLATRQANEYVIEAARRRPDLFLPLLLVSDDVRYFEQQRDYIVGAKEEFYLPGARDPTRFLPIYDFLEQNNLILFIHPHREERISRVLQIRRDFPRLRMILAHSGRKWPYSGQDVIETIVPALGKIDDLFFDTSTIRNCQVLQSLVKLVGASRVIFGSDFPFYDKLGEDIYEQEFHSVVSADLADHDRSLIVRGNLQSLFLRDVWSRRVAREDDPALMRLLDELSPLDRRYLALDKKLAALRSNLRDERHIFVLEDRVGLSGFLRESGRYKNGAVIEEVCVRPISRGKGYGERLVRMAKGMFATLEAKTFAANETMNRLLERAGFTAVSCSRGKSILYWKWPSVR